jgi:hypothetical protein
MPVCEILLLPCRDPSQQFAPRTFRDIRHVVDEEDNRNLARRAALGDADLRTQRLRSLVEVEIEARAPLRYESGVVQDAPRAPMPDCVFCVDAWVETRVAALLERGVTHEDMAQRGHGLWWDN